MKTKYNNKLSFLLIVPSFACNPSTGAGQRTSLLYQILKNLGVVDILLIGEGEPQFLERFFQEANSLHVIKPREPAEIGLWRLIRPLSPKILDLVATIFGPRKSLYQTDPNILPLLYKLQASNNYDFVIGRYLRPTARSGSLYLGEIPVILDVDDRDDMVYKSRLNRSDINFIHRLIFMWHFRQAQQIMADLLPICKHIWLTSEIDLDEVKHPSKSVLPNIPYFLDFENNFVPLPENNSSKTVLFVGSFGHRVNREGVERFISKCWPIISSAVEGATLRIVGSGGWEKLREKFYDIPNVHIIGFVENLEEEYKQAAFTVVPLFEGGGTKIKVLESLFYQRTAVVTTSVQCGYKTLKNRETLLVVSDESELVNGCIELLVDFDLRLRLAEKGRSVVLNEYSYNRFSAIIRKTILDLSENLK
ncbi:glycosyltransferase [Nodularia sp. NIES-3585]|uniref:glycosyltransferase n=1 Tax=Nodularia sp. NIES-3585 TaxID=1973477 RepID=UPI000B5CA931|nr:glycosyltransferase [Nodularia sp. NIES-3585]GAX37563.1 group 1 glycosyl transferase [Nodularia sp. NIES-3585]